MNKVKPTIEEIKEIPASNLITLGQILSNPPTTPESLLGDWLSSNTCTMIHAPSGIGKSWLAMGIGLAVAGAGRISKWQAESAKKVLYVDGEMSAHSRFKRLELLSKKMTFGAKSLLWKNMNIIPPEAATKIDQKTSIADYQSLISENEIGLLIIDNIRTLADLKDENSAASWSIVNDFLKALRAQCAVIVVHHDGKRSGYSGSSNAITVLDNQLGLSSLSVSDCNGQKIKEAGIRFSYKFHKVRDSFDDNVSGCIGFHDQYGWINNTNRETESRMNLFETKALAESGQFTAWKALASYLGITDQALTKRRKKYEELYGEKINLVPPERLEIDDAVFSNLSSVFCMPNQ